MLNRLITRPRAALLLSPVFSAALVFTAGPAQAADMAAGQNRYALNCVNCHGRAGKGMASFPALVGRDAAYIRGDCPDNYCGYMPNQMDGMQPEERARFMPMTDTRSYPDAMPPAWNNNGLSQGISSAEFLTGKQWGAWDGRLAVGVMGIGFGGTAVGMRIDVLDLAEDGQSVNEVITLPLPTVAGRFRSVVQGPDGALYAAVDQGEIYRIMPE